MTSRMRQVCYRPVGGTRVGAVGGPVGAYVRVGGTTTPPPSLSMSVTLPSGVWPWVVIVLIVGGPIASPNVVAIAPTRAEADAVVIVVWAASPTAQVASRRVSPIAAEIVALVPPRLRRFVRSGVAARLIAAARSFSSWRRRPGWWRAAGWGIGT